MPAAFASLAAVAVLGAARAGGGVDAAPVLGALATVGVARRTSSSTTALVAGLATAAVAAHVL
jgi:hypothetical protein